MIPLPTEPVTPPENGFICLHFAYLFCKFRPYATITFFRPHFCPTSYLPSPHFYCKMFTSLPNPLHHLKIATYAYILLVWFLSFGSMQHSFFEGLLFLYNILFEWPSSPFFVSSFKGSAIAIVCGIVQGRRCCQFIRLSSRYK